MSTSKKFFSSLKNSFILNEFFVPSHLQAILFFRTRPDEIPYNCTNDVVLASYINLKFKPFNGSMITNNNFFFDLTYQLKFTNLNYSVVAAARLLYIYFVI